MEQTLRQRADLLDLASEAIMVRDLNGTVQFWNSGATALYGWSSEEALGKNLHQLLKTQFPVPNQEIESMVSEGKRWEGNLVQYTKDDREIVVACRKILQSDGNKPRVVLEYLPGHHCRDCRPRKHFADQKGSPRWGEWRELSRMKLTIHLSRSLTCSTC